jgi:ankyrin repeat protein
MQKTNPAEQRYHTPLKMDTKNSYVGRLLLATGQVKVAIKDRYDLTPLWYATRKGHRAVIKLLITTEWGLL